MYAASAFFLFFVFKYVLLNNCFQKVVIHDSHFGTAATAT